MDTNTTTIIPITKINLTDIHSHILNNVDDGSDSLENSKQNIDYVKNKGLKNIVCTPHMVSGNKEKIEKINNNFSILKKYAKENEINLLLGNEIMLTSSTNDLLKEQKLKSINGTNYLLVEFKRSENMNIDSLIESLEDIQDLGYYVILAHPELYKNYNKIKYIKKIKEAGVFLQLDATSILRSKTNYKIHNFSKKLIKYNLIDIVASDSHCNQKRSYKDFFKAYKKIKRKYGKEIAYKLFYENPTYIINGGII